ncbi:Oidioi.mRNA.OKI2018_I69.PAR.g10143.t1.cds [Oikopleura dioica]|uniref:Oidioi.mRNA.OKI2018_I69.PAR.g10143.t1.cds n=1 Tax=Oikopleura dioica TaxID=34765 RepID=A0ABN7RP31_OIKDI|nr:Oidioi.mRNA.OKI2018_I69.PAR.g10143.t1.cds [Oikopleura dioica]
MNARKEHVRRLNSELEETKDVLSKCVLGAVKARQNLLIGLDSTAENMARSAHQFEEISRDVMDEQKVKASCFPPLTAFLISTSRFVSEKLSNCRKRNRTTSSNHILDDGSEDEEDIEAMVNEIRQNEVVVRV